MVKVHLHLVDAGVLPGGLQRFRGDVRGQDRCPGQVFCQGDGDASAPGADVKDRERSFFLFQQTDHPVRQLFGLGAGDQHSRVHGDTAVIKSCFTQDILQGHTLFQLPENIINFRQQFLGEGQRTVAQQLRVAAAAHRFRHEAGQVAGLRRLTVLL